jgi:hypothetical protein
MVEFIDSGLRTIIQWVFPLPLISDALGDIVCKYKLQIILILSIILIIPLVIVLGAFSSLNPSKQGSANPVFASGINGTALNIATIPDSLKTYIDPNILDSGIPNGNPFGGSGMSWVGVGCAYYCSNYGFGNGSHYGLDTNPNQLYYSQSELYKTTNLPIVLGTCTGFATTGYDNYGGGNYVKIKCNLTQYTVFFMHLSSSYIPSSGAEITAGQPIGVMGESGNVSGPHLHYQIKNCDQGNFNSCTLNPSNFIN